MELKKAINSDWGTPKHIFDLAESLFGKHDLDVCAEPGWSMCSNFIDKNKDCLSPSTDWTGQNIWCNPPYDAKTLTKFVNRALIESTNGKKITMLVPVKSEQAWFHQLIDANCGFYFIKSRIIFNRKNGNKANNAGFPSVFIRIDNNLTIPTIKWIKIP